VITDIRMADVDGLEAAAQINRELATPVIVLSAHHDPALRARANEDYVQAYLVKPVKQPDLETAIDQAIHRFRRQQRCGRRRATSSRRWKTAR